MVNLLGISLTLVLLWIGSKYRKHRKTLRSLQCPPVLRYFFRVQSSGLTMLLPPIPYVSLGFDWPIKLKHKIFSSRGDCDIISFITCFPSIQPGFIIGDPFAIKEIFAHRDRFIKYHEIYTRVEVFGDNIIIAERGEWKRHRKLVAPSFSEKNNRMVWEESVKVIFGLMDEQWGKDTNIITIEHIPDLTVQMSLRIISAAGFGRIMSWEKDSHKVPYGHKPSFEHTLYNFVKGIPLKIIAPKWLSHLFPIVREAHESFRDLQLYMEEIVIERRQMRYNETPRHDLFNALLTGNEDGWDDANDKLTDQQLFANMFIFLFAGHETVAHALAYTLGLLAIHEDEQENLYKHIIENLNGVKIPSYEQMSRFSYVMATFYEAMRLFPLIPAISKQATEDATIPVRGVGGFIDQILVPKGSHLLLDIIALHYNPKYWPDPEKFDPSRFLGEWNKDAFVPFSGGSRACIGRRFAEVEAVALLAILLKNYKVELKDPINYAGLDKLEIRVRLLKSQTQITLMPLHESLVFRKRE